MKGCLFIILSDIHVKNSNHKVIKNKLEKFITHVKTLKLVKNKEKIVIIVSGDIAYSGKKEEYESIREQFQQLKDNYSIIICPGNHDHDFDQYNNSDSVSSRNRMLHMQADELDDGAIQYASSGMQSYRDFETEFSNCQILQENPISKLFNIGDTKNSFLVESLNTAWCSTMKERGGDIHFPSKYILSSKEKKAKIMFFHHPLAWFEPNNSKQIRNLIRESSSIVITGHEHLSDSFKVDTDAVSTLMIESMPLDDSSISKNGFLTFEIEDGDVLLTNYIWQKDDFIEGDPELKSDIVERKSNLVSNKFEIKNLFFEKLQDTGVSYSHQSKEKLTMSDIFIYPKIKRITHENEQIKRLSSSEILSIPFKKIILIGEEFTGKTTLLKKIFIDAMNANILPLYLECDEIRKAGKSVDKLLEKSINEQYVQRTLVDFTNTDAEKLVLIDNFDEIRNDKKTLKNLMSIIENIFDRIIITVGDDYEISEYGLIDEPILGDEYIRYNLLKFGFQLRYDLVNKWNSIKQECSNERKILLLKNDNASRMIDTIIGRNYIPSTPFFLLTMLQSFDDNQSNDMKTSSYGYYYQYLITSNLGLSSVNKEQLDEIFNYITELSYHFYCNKKQEDSKENLWIFNKKFCDEYGVQIDFGDRFNLLVNAKILNKTAENYYCFKYHYIYYFFIAKYFADHLNESEVTVSIDLMIESLNHKQSMSILMFITHHTKDETILNKIVNKAQKLFSGVKPAEIDIDADFINTIIDNLPDIEFTSQDRLTFRRESERLRDEISNDTSDDSENPQTPSKDTKSNVQNVNDLYEELSLSFRSLELLGQLSRNYYGSLKMQQKEKLLEAAIETPLRSLGYLLDLLSREPDKLIDALESKINEMLHTKNSYTNLQVREVAKQILFRMVLGISYNMVTKISSSIGSTQLQLVINKVCDELGSNSGKIIKLASMLELGQNLSMDELKEIIHNINNNHLSSMLVKTIVINYLYMFERSDQDVQRICHIAKISYAPISKDIAFQKISKSK